MFTTPVRAKHKARERAIVSPMASERNAVVGAHRRCRHCFLIGGRGCPRPWTALQRLPRALTMGGALRLATNTDSLAEHGKITLTEHSRQEAGRGPG